MKRTLTTSHKFYQLQGNSLQDTKFWVPNVLFQRNQFSVRRVSYDEKCAWKWNNLRETNLLPCSHWNPAGGASWGQLQRQFLNTFGFGQSDSFVAHTNLQLVWFFMTMEPLVFVILSKVMNLTSLSSRGAHLCKEGGTNPHEPSQRCRDMKKGYLFGLVNTTDGLGWQNWLWCILPVPRKK